jgi:hypothetical protein
MTLLSGFLCEEVVVLAGVRLEGVSLVNSDAPRRMDVRVATAVVVVVEADVVDDNLSLTGVPLFVPTVLALTFDTVDPPDNFLERGVIISEGAVLNVASLIALDKLEFGREVDGIRSVDSLAEERTVETRERTEGAIDFGFEGGG